MSIAEAGLIINLIISAVLIIQKIMENRHKPKVDLENVSKTDIDASASAAAAIKQYSDEIIRLRAENKTAREQAQNDYNELKKNYDAQIKTLTDKVTTLESNRTEDRATIEEWQTGIRRLLAQMESLGIIPVWKPSNLKISSWKSD